MQNLSDMMIDETMKDQYLTFEIDGEDYGVEIAFVKEIIKMKKVTTVPEMPNFIEGLINLRGELIGVLDVRKRFGLPEVEHDEETCIIVMVYGEYTLGMIIDRVLETVTIDNNMISPPPSAKLNYANQFIRNIGTVGAKVKLLIDIERFLSQD